MVTSVALPLASEASLVLEKADDTLLATLWSVALMNGGRRADFGMASMNHCKRDLLRLLDPDSLEFFPADATYPECAYVTAFSDELGPNTSLYVIRGSGAFELAWKNRQEKFHRTGIILDRKIVATWPALLEVAAAQEIWPPSKAYRMMRERENK